MKHHQYNPNYRFIIPPVDFNKYTDRSLLQYCFGAAMYMPGTSRDVIKGTQGMNEIGPHKNWAEKIMMRAQACGVIETDASYIELFGV